MNGYFSDAGQFLVGFLFGFYILVVMLRFLLQTVRADFHNPFSQFVFRLTHPVIRPLRRFIPGWGGIDVATLVLLLALDLLKYLLLHAMAGKSLHLALLFVLAVGDLFHLALLIFQVAIIAEVILSWIQTGSHPLGALLYQLTAPVLRPFRRLIPPVSGIDLSPMAALVVIYLVDRAIPYLQASLLRLLP